MHPTRPSPATSLRQGRGILTWLALAALPLAAPPGAAGQSSAEQEVMNTLTAMWAAIEARDLETYASFVHPDFTQFGENDPYLASGKDLELRGMSGYFERARDVHTEMHQPSVVIRGDVAWITYYWTDSGMVGAGRFTSRGKSTRIFVREGGRWLCIHGHYTAVP